MRLLLAAFTIAALAPNAALASSFVTVEPPKPGATPSIAAIGTAVDPAGKIATFIGNVTRLASPAPKGDQPKMANISASIVSLGDAVPPVTMEKVSAIGKRQNLPEPMVMRGGIAGAAFSRAEAPDDAAVPEKPVQEEASRGDAIPSTVRGGGYGGAGSGAGRTMAGKPPAPATPAAQPTAQHKGPMPQ